MQIAILIKAPKVVLEAGKWQSGKLPRMAFSLSRTTLKLGPAWRWRVETLTMDDKRFRLFVCFRLDREEFRAYLAKEMDSGLMVLARLEDHGSHPGLHLHVQCDDSRSRPMGRLVYPDLLRIPRSGRIHRRRGGFTEMTAWACAQTFFNVVGSTEGMLL